MKTIEIKVIKKSEPNTFTYGGFDVELKYQSKTIEAFVNLKNFVSVNKETYMHSLFQDAPFTSDYVKKVNDAIQVAFKEWHVGVTNLNIHGV